MACANVIATLALFRARAQALLARTFRFIGASDNNTPAKLTDYVATT
jgi:hypothetical protein